MGLIGYIFLRAVVRDARQHVPRGKVSRLRATERGSAACRPSYVERCETITAQGRACLRQQTCGVSAPCCGMPCVFFIVSPVASEDSCWGRTVIWLVGVGLAS